MDVTVVTGVLGVGASRVCRDARGNEDDPDAAGRRLAGVVEQGDRSR